MISIHRTKNIEDLVEIFHLMTKYFKAYELVSSNEFIYYADNYCKLYKGEDYFVYKIMVDNRLVGMLSGVKLNELITVDYFIIERQYRQMSKEIINKALNILLKYNRPIIVEAETETLCRLYRILGFKRFKETYQYIMLHVNLRAKTSEVSIHDSNLLYYSYDDMDFENTARILREKHYMRWNSIYGEDLTRGYKKALGL